MAEVRVRVDAVQVVGRHRRDLGDVEGLAASIKRDGLIHAIAVTPDMRLLAGERRLAAARSLGWDSIDARIIDNLDDAVARLRIERDENIERKPMTPSELVALGKTLEGLERPKAEARMRAGKRQEARPSPQQRIGSGSTDDVVASALGISDSTYDRARFVVNTATNPDVTPEERANAQEALAEMDTTGKVGRAYRKVRTKTDRPRRGSPRPAPEPPAITTARDQRRAIEGAIVTLSGVTYGLEQITELDPSITSEEAAQWVDDLSKSRGIIARLINQLKEHTNAQL